MTKADFENKYGDFKLTFSRYYKYSFTYTGATDDGVEIEASYGGNGEDIYKHEVVNNDKEFVGKPVDDFWSSITARIGKDVIFHWDEY
jgi:hypothetical protein